VIPSSRHAIVSPRETIAPCERSHHESAIWTWRTARWTRWEKKGRRRRGGGRRSRVGGAGGGGDEEGEVVQGGAGECFREELVEGWEGPLMLREERLGKSGEGGVEEESEEGGEERKGGGR